MTGAQVRLLVLSVEVDGGDRGHSTNDVQHPGGGVDMRFDRSHSRDALEVFDEMLRLDPKLSKEDGSASLL